MAERGKIAGNLFVLQHKGSVQPLMVSIFFWAETFLLGTAFLTPFVLRQYFAGMGLLSSIIAFVYGIIYLFWVFARILNRKAIIEQRIWLQDNAKLRAPEDLNT